MDKDKYIIQLKNKIAELEEELDEFDLVLSNFSVAEKKMIEIIGREIGRLDNESKSYKLDKDQVKIFDTYVKDFVQLRGKVEKLVKKEDSDDDIADLIALAGAKIEK